MDISLTGKGVGSEKKLHRNDLKMMNYNRIVHTTKFIRNGGHGREKKIWCKFSHNCIGTSFSMKFSRIEFELSIHSTF